MAGFTWTYDAPTGTYKSHAMSKRLYTQAVEESVMMDYTRPVEGFGRKKGDTVTLTRLSSIAEPTTGLLSETERIPEDTYAISTTAITVKEFGRSVPFTSFAEDLSFFDLENGVQRGLTDQMKLVMDTRAALQFKQASVKYAPTGITSSTITTNGTFGATATANLNVFHVEEIADYLYDTLLAPPYEGDDYIGVFRRLALRGVKRDPAWEEWHKYTDPQAKYNGEVGRIERIRLVETNHANAFGKVGTSSVLGEGVVFGRDAVALAEVQTPELRAAIPQDFGRSKAVAWYGVFELGLIWTTGNAGQARVMHVGSL